MKTIQYYKYLQLQIFLILSIFILFCDYFPGKTFDGYVTDSATYQPIDSALVALISIGETKAFCDSTNSEGYFTFSHIPTFDYSVTISKIGYDTIFDTIQESVNSRNYQMVKSY